MNLPLSYRKGTIVKKDTISWAQNANFTPSNRANVNN